MTNVRSISHARWWVLGVLSLAIMVVSLDITILNTALPTIASDLGARTSDLQWIVDAYSLTFAGAMLPAGLIGDRFGRKRVLVTGLSVFLAASVWCAVSTTSGELIWARALMGLGAAIVMPLTIAIISAIFTDSERPKAIGIVTAAVAIGMPLGPILGGVLLQHFSWSSVFWINVPVVAVALAAGIALLPESKNPNARPLDIPGSLLSVASVVAIVFGIIRGPQDGWGSPVVVALLGAGVVFLAAFLIRQRTARYPLVDSTLFADRRFTWGTVATVAISITLFGILFVMPQYFQLVQGADALMTGLRLVPLMAGILVAGASSSLLVKRLGTRTTITAALLPMAAGFVVLSGVSTTTGYALAAVGLILCGFGVGAGVAAAMDAVMAASGGDEAGAGASVNSTLRQVGGALAVAGLGSILSSIYAERLRPSLGGMPASAARAASGSIEGAHAIGASLGPAGHGLNTFANLAFVNGLSAVMGSCAVIALAAAVLTILFFPGGRRLSVGAPKAAMEDN